MRILILNPPDENKIVEYPNDDGEGYLESDDFGLFPPLGALYVISYLEKNNSGHELFFKDCVAERISQANLESVIREIQPDVVGITSFTITLVDIVIAAKTIRKVVPGAHLCLGGHHPIAFPFQAAKLKAFDSIIVGEGEIAFTQLIKALEARDDIATIKGVYTSKSIDTMNKKSFKDKRFLTNVTLEPAYIDNIDDLPFPNRSFIKHIDYHSIVGVTGKLATIISSRGCPYLCTFCDVPYKKYRQREVKHVLDEVEECLNMGYKEVHFYDDLFNITSQKVIEYCDEIKRRGLQFPWDFRGRVNSVTKESLVRAKESGCRLISFGVETGSDDGLKNLNKNTTIFKIKEVFRWCKELNIKTVADFMIGLPFEKNKKDVLENIDFLIELEPDYAQFGILTLYPNTQLYEEAIRKGLIKKDRWEEYSLNPARGFTVDHWEEFLSVSELVELQKTAYMKFYLRPQYIFRHIFNTKSFFELKAKARGVLKLIS